MFAKGRLHMDYKQEIISLLNRLTLEQLKILYQFIRGMLD